MRVEFWENLGEVSNYIHICQNKGPGGSGLPEEGQRYQADVSRSGRIREQGRPKNLFCPEIFTQGRGKK